MPAHRAAIDARRAEGERRGELPACRDAAAADVRLAERERSLGLEDEVAHVVLARVACAPQSAA